MQLKAVLKEEKAKNGRKKNNHYSRKFLNTAKVKAMLQKKIKKMDKESILHAT